MTCGFFSLCVYLNGFSNILLQTGKIKLEIEVVCFGFVFFLIRRHQFIFLLIFKNSSKIPFAYIHTYISSVFVNGKNNEI